MPNFKISVSKENKRYTIIFKADSEGLARERVHKEGYSILGIEEISSKENIGHTFIFEAYKSGELKHGKITGTDIFKVYVNLVKNLEYDVVYLYSENDKDKTEEYKKKIVDELKEEYELISKGKKDKIDELREQIKKERGEKINKEDFYMKKELEETNKLMIHVLMKLESMILGNSEFKITPEEKEKFENIYNSIIKLKKSTNISKLKEIGEVALQKIGKMELSKLEETKDENSRKLLNETNKLLKELGSKDRFIEKDKDFGLKVKKFFENLKLNFSKKTEKVQVDEIDKESHFYVRNQLYLSKYEEKLRENNFYMFKNFFKLLRNPEQRELNFLKRNVIKQNIFLYKSRLNGKVISYSFISKGFFGVFGMLNNFLGFFRKNLFYMIFIYILIFLLSLSFSILTGYNFNYNFDGIFLFLVFLLAYIFLSISEKIYFIIINFALFCFIVILGVINF